MINQKHLESAIRSETTFVTRIEMGLCAVTWGLESTEQQYRFVLQRIRAEYKRLRNKKGKRRMAA